jgi:hypothetical protein
MVAPARAAIDAFWLFGASDEIGSGETANSGVFHGACPEVGADLHRLTLMHMHQGKRKF